MAQMPFMEHSFQARHNAKCFTWYTLFKYLYNFLQLYGVSPFYRWVNKETRFVWLLNSSAVYNKTLSELCQCKQIFFLLVPIHSVFSELGSSWGEVRSVESKVNLQRSHGEKVDPFCGSEVHNVDLTNRQMGRKNKRAPREFALQEEDGTNGWGAISLWGEYCCWSPKPWQLAWPKKVPGVEGR